MARLDDKMQQLLDGWLDANLPHIAEESQEQFTRDVGVLVLEAQENGATPAQAMKCLPRPWILRLGWRTSYLTEFDIETLADISKERDTPAKSMKSVCFYISLGIAVCMFSIMLIVLDYSNANVASTSLLIGGLIILWNSTRLARDFAINSMGPIGVAVVSPTGSSIITAGLFSITWIIDILFTSSFGLNIDSLFVCAASTIFFAAMPMYVTFVHRVHNNRNIVGRILGLPGYEDDAET